VSRSISLDLSVELPKAWAVCWAEWCEPKDIGDAENGPQLWEPRQRWLTATDLEQRLRAAAVEKLDGIEYGKLGRGYGYGMGVTIRFPDNSRATLLDRVRDWLREQVAAGQLVCHNFGRGHISGMRFRPPGVELTEGEKATLETKRKRAAGEAVVHLYTGENWFQRRPLCTPPRKKSTFRPRQRSKAEMTSEPEKVTCPRCKKLLTAAIEKKASVANG
jgi:hypothetical protein